MKLRRLFTWPGDLGLRFLLWREDSNDFIHLVVLPLVPVAYIFMIISDLIDDLLDYYTSRD